ncbi:MAG TPA: succinate dehydrogenase cytochrome b subunit [Jatrophihabitantaceae bacterium]|jgi:succinate dehydrogenase / fumarate reductase cytochrome b subunit|nr:succinate dehydrogenase cytochrome b subunit [Jatrophihabitantaceae bacterium]
MTKPKTRGSVPSRRQNGVRALWQSSIGKKWVMAVTGLIMILFLLLHMLGNLKIFFGPRDFDAYAHWLRTIGEPVLHGAWYLWIQRVVLAVALLLHITAAAQLTRRDRAARPLKYAHGQRPKATFATHTMRYGGIVLGLFIIWHLLDLTAGVTNPDFEKGRAYHNIYVDFQHWWINLIYIVALVVLGLHINHGFWSASQTLGINNPTRDKAIKAVGSILAVVISVGFIMVPVGVMTGIVK